MSMRSIDEAVSDAVDAFWAKIAESYPMAKTGDLPPEAVVAFDEAAEKAAKLWVEWNVPD